MRVSLVSEPGSQDRPNEDFAATTSQVAVVLDGLSAPAELGTGCVHGTPWYVRQLGTGLLRAATNQPTDSLREIVADVIAEVAGLHDSCDLAHPGTPSSSVLLVREAAESVDFLILFDSVLLVRDATGVTMLTDDRVLAFAKDEREATRWHRIGTSNHRAAVRELVDAERSHRNVEDGYWVAGAKPEVAVQAVTGRLERAQLRAVALMTDGVSCLADTYELTSWEGLLAHLESAGPADVIAHIRAAEATDPEGERWPRYKSSDDATAAVCQFEPVSD